jgi:anti-sigma regulatory factor (Ser/Thr protein kinase)
MKADKNGISPVSSNQGVAELGHELGNVLNGLLGMTRLVRDSGLNAEQERWLRAIEQSGRQMRWLVDAFRCEPGCPDPAIPHHPVRLDGIDMLEQALLAHAPSARDSFNRLLLVADPQLPRYWMCDPRPLRQVLDNLLGNALKFTNSGEVVLEAERPGRQKAGPGDLRITVTDSGPGIDATLGSRMFAAYEQGEASVTGRSMGRGLGLFIARRIVESMGGAISWSSPANGGVRFEVLLPGVLAHEPAASGKLPTGMLRNLDCQVDLAGPLRRSVIGCLARLGTGHRHQEGEWLRVSLTELPMTGDHPGPVLGLTAQTAAGEVIGSKRLQAPILECSLGPLLLEFALEWLWIRNEKPGFAR